MGTGPAAALNPHLRTSPQQAAPSPMLGHFRPPLGDHPQGKLLQGPVCQQRSGSCSYNLKESGMGGITVLEPRISRYSNPAPLSMVLICTSAHRKNQCLVDVSSASTPQCVNTTVAPASCFSRGDAALKRVRGSMLVRSKHLFPQVSQKARKIKANVSYNKSFQHTPQPP